MALELISSNLVASLSQLSHVRASMVAKLTFKVLVVVRIKILLSFSLKLVLQVDSSFEKVPIILPYNLPSISIMVLISLMGNLKDHTQVSKVDVMGSHVADMVVRASIVIFYVKVSIKREVQKATLSNTMSSQGSKNELGLSFTFSSIADLHELVSSCFAVRILVESLQVSESLPDKSLRFMKRLLAGVPLSLLISFREIFINGSLKVSNLVFNMVQSIHDLVASSKNTTEDG